MGIFGKKRVGVVGLGMIGSRVAANLRRAGHPVFVYSRSPKPVPNFLGSLTQLAEHCRVVQLFVSDDAALESCVDGLLEGIGRRHVVINHATVSPGAVMGAAERIGGRGAMFLNAPFTGSRDAAEGAELVYYVGGDVGVLDGVRSVLEASSRRIMHVGGIEQAAVIKIATNLITAATCQVLAEALVLCRDHGVADGVFAEALEWNGARSGVSDMKLPKMVGGDYEAHFKMRHMLKDVVFGMGLAEGSGRELPVTREVWGRLMAGVERGDGELDFAALARQFDEGAGGAVVGESGVAGGGRVPEAEDPEAEAGDGPADGSAGAEVDVSRAAMERGSVLAADLALVGPRAWEESDYEDEYEDDDVPAVAGGFGKRDDGGTDSATGGAGGDAAPLGEAGEAVGGEETGGDREAAVGEGAAGEDEEFSAGGGLGGESRGDDVTLGEHEERRPVVLAALGSGSLGEAGGNVAGDADDGDDEENLPRIILPPRRPREEVGEREVAFGPPSDPRTGVGEASGSGDAEGVGDAWASAGGAEGVGGVDEAEKAGGVGDAENAKGVGDAGDEESVESVGDEEVLERVGPEDGGEAAVGRPEADDVTGGGRSGAVRSIYAGRNRFRPGGVGDE